MDLSDRGLAIWGHNLCLNVGQSWKPITIFQNLSIKVPKGAIYGLIGPSGCGKTTLQRCIFGFYRPTSGNLLVFGRAPKEKGFGVPGPLVGFMPQDLALNEDLTIREMLTFFGRLSDLPMDTINGRIDELLKVIDIPFPDRLISNLSIGQQRRISLAASLVHRPKLLLLDEPTVGSDPLLVYKMWNYLFYLRDTYKMTIVVTTHYLEEIVKADRFGLMRKGHIIAEDNPKSFMDSYKESSLEKAVFKLCVEWDKRREASSSPDGRTTNEPTNHCAAKGKTMTKVTVDPKDRLQRSRRSIPTSPDSSSSTSCTTLSSITSIASSASSRSISSSPSTSLSISATETWTPLSTCTVLSILMWRLWLRCRRFMIYPIVLSCFIIFIITGTFSSMFGRFPKNIRLDYLVSETGAHNISTQYLSLLLESDFTLRRAHSELESRSNLESGLIDGYFTFGEKFGESLMEKIEHGLANLGTSGRAEPTLRVNVEDKILLTVDAANQFKLDTLVIKMSRCLAQLLQKIRKHLNITTNYYQFFTVTPVYASHESEDLMASNEIVLVRYFLYAVEQFTIILIMSWTMQEAKEKMNERLMAAGISRTHLTFSLMVTSLLVIVPIYMVLFTVIVPTLNFPMRGSWLTVTSAIFAITLCGITKGIFIGLISADLIMASFIHSGYCFSSLFMGYLLGPYESLPNFIKPTVYWFPFALSSDSLVWSLIKGKPFTDPLVYPAILYSTLFGLGSAMVVLICFRKW